MGFSQIRYGTLWTLVSLSGKAEWTELRIRTKLTGAELDTVLSKLTKDGRIRIIPGQRANHVLILLKRDENMAKGSSGPMKKPPRPHALYVIYGKMAFARACGFLGASSRSSSSEFKKNAIDPTRLSTKPPPGSKNVKKSKRVWKTILEGFLIKSKYFYYLRIY